MKKVGLLIVSALMLCVLAGFGASPASAQGAQITVQMLEQNGSGESGTATITEENGQIMVTLNLTGAPAGVAQPAHIHEGTCANLNPSPKYPLTTVMDGASTTTVPVTLGDLTGSQAYAINVHKSATEAKIYVACGDISPMTTGPAGGTGSTPGMPSTGSGDLPLAFLALALLGLAALSAGLRVRSANR